MKHQDYDKWVEQNFPLSKNDIKSDKCYQYILLDGSTGILSGDFILRNIKQCNNANYTYPEYRFAEVKQVEIPKITERKVTEKDIGKPVSSHLHGNIVLLALMSEKDAEKYLVTQEAIVINTNDKTTFRVKASNLSIKC